MSLQLYNFFVQYSGSSKQPATSTVFKAVNCAIVIFSLVSHCERTYRQRDRIIKLIDHLTLFKKLGRYKLFIYDFL